MWQTADDLPRGFIGKEAKSKNGPTALLVGAERKNETFKKKK